MRVLNGAGISFIGSQRGLAEEEGKEGGGGIEIGILRLCMEQGEGGEGAAL